MIEKLQCYFATIGVFACIMMMLGACVPPRVDNRGHVDAFNRMGDIQPGVTSKSEVEEMLGSPSLRNHFGEEIWYYVRERKESVAFLEPEITDQHVTRITFGRDALVASVDHYGIDDREEVAVATEVTTTEGQELGFFEQILGNLGRFNANDGPAAARNAGGGAGGPMRR